MAVSRKPLRAIVHNFNNSFLSVMNYGPWGSSIEHIVRNAIKHSLDELSVDLLTGVAGPQKMLTPAVALSVDSYAKSFPKHVSRGGSSMRFLRKATLRIKVDWERPRQTHWQPPAFGYRVTSEVSVHTDLGRQYAATKREIWPGPRPRLRLLSRK